MATVFLSILKITGIILLCILLFLLAAVLLVLFVPIRYRLKGYRKMQDDAPVRVSVKITWLLHMVSAVFRYPEAAYVRVKLFCFTVFSTEKTPGKEEEKSSGKKKAKKTNQTQEETPVSSAKEKAKEETIAEDANTERADTEEAKKTETKTEDAANAETEAEKAQDSEEKPGIADFVGKLFHILKNIKYTINQIYDKIKHMIRNIRYYIGIIESDSFKRAWQLCRGQAVSLIKSILPRRIEGSFVIGLEDPASTARILAIQGMLYPITGNHILITPDFERSITEGDFFIKGKITVFRVLKTAVKVYFNKDLRRVIRLFKKEAA